MLKRALIAIVLAAAPAPLLAACEINQLLELKVTMVGATPTIDAKINGRDARLVVASGAFFNTLSPGSAQELGLRLKGAPPGSTVRGIGGDASISVTSAKDFALAGLTLHNVEFVVGGSEIRVGVGALGQNVLGMADVEYDLGHGAVRLIRPKGCGTLGMAYWAKDRPYSVLDIAERSPQRPDTIGTLMLNGVKIRAIFDTGSGTSILSLAAAARAGIKTDDPGVVQAGAVSGLGRHVLQSWIAPVREFAIGDSETLRRIKLRIGAIDLENADMLIGTDFFLSHRVYVANGQHKLYFTYEGGPVFNVTPARLVTADGAAVAPPVDTPATPTDAEGFSRRGAAYSARAQFDLAVADFTHAMDLAPTNGRYPYQRAIARWEMRQPLLAMADLDRTLALQPDDVDAHLARGRLRLQQHDHPGALVDFDAADRFAAPASDRRFALASDYGSVDSFTKAVAQYDLWIRAHPDDSRRGRALNGRCWMRAELGSELDKALADCNASIRWLPHTANPLDSRGLVHLRRGEFDKAVADYSAALAIEPKSAWSLYGRGLAERRQGLKPQGDADIAAATALNPRLADRVKALGLTE